MATISTGAAIITPSIVLGYQSAREPRTIIHDILGRESPDVTLRPASLRAGTLSLGFEGDGAEASSRTAEALLSAASTFTFSEDGVASVAMTFVVSGSSISRELENETRAAWIVSFGYQEIAS